MGKQHKGTRAPHRGSTGSEVTPPPPPSTGAAPGRTSSQSGGQRGYWAFCRVTAGSHVGTETGAGPRGQGARSAFRDANCLDMAWRRRGTHVAPAYLPALWIGARVTPLRQVLPAGRCPGGASGVDGSLADVWLSPSTWGRVAQVLAR